MKKVFALFAIILGIITIAFPLAIVMAASIITGLVFIFVGFWFSVSAYYLWKFNKTAATINGLLGLFSLLAGADLLFDANLFAFIAGFYLYAGGIFLIIAGISNFFMTKQKKYATWMTLLSILLGIAYIVLGIYSIDPRYLGTLMGIWILLDGICLFIEPKDPSGL